MNNTENTNQKISVVVPVYNEKGIIQDFHNQLIGVLTQTNAPFEIIYIDDNSSDGTFEWLESVSGSISNEGTRRLYDSAYRRNATVQSLGEIKVVKKLGKKGKAYSLYEGFSYATGSALVMIDGDLQYPPSVIPEMVQMLDETDIVIANRKEYNDSKLRKLLSKTFKFFVQQGFGLQTDIQSGLKAFSRTVFETVKFEPTSGWTFDLEFLHRARQAGFSSKNLDITFLPRTSGSSKINTFKASVEIGLNSLSVKSKKIAPLAIPTEDSESMKGAGLGYKKQKYITHTTLPHSLSALKTFSVRQKLYALLLVVFVIGGFAFWPLSTARVLVSVLSILYFIDTVFFFSLVIRSLHKPEEYHVTDEEIQALPDSYLPIYTILCPLYKEAHVVPQFVEAISNLNWPKEKLDVMLLLEEDDKETVAKISAMSLPEFVRIVVVPDSLPKTKPKACNYGLAFAKGEYLVIYDAEDMPDPLQLKKAFIAFQKAPTKVQCLQAKLNYYNSRQNILTRFFTAEYSLWFDLTLTGLQSLNSALPLGGTSNHFKTKVLRDLQGWDPFNVTEDADLGVRLFQKGYQTAILDSTTLEEATSKMHNWLRQRSRWLKGYMQTYLVHTRNYKTALKEKGLFHNIIFQLSVGGKILFILLNPLMWVVTIVYFAFYNEVSGIIEAIYVPPISYIAVFSWIFGNFLFLYAYMLGVAKRGQWDLMKYVFIIPFYWLMMSVAGAIGFWQLLFKPHYWEKTVHGFHLLKNPTDAESTPEESAIVEVIPEPVVTPVYEPAVVRAPFALPTISFNDFLMWNVVLLISVVAIDITLANYFLPASELETYWLLALVGKGAFIVSQVFALLFTKLFTKQKQMKILPLLFFTFLFNWVTFVALGWEGATVVPYFGERFLSIIPYLPFYTLGLMCFALGNVFAIYHLQRKVYLYAILSFLITLSQTIFLSTNSDTISYLIKIFAYVGAGNFLVMIIMHANPQMIPLLQKSVRTIFGILPKPQSYP